MMILLSVAMLVVGTLSAFAQSSTCAVFTNEPSVRAYLQQKGYTRFVSQEAQAKAVVRAEFFEHAQVNGRACDFMGGCTQTNRMLVNLSVHRRAGGQFRHIGSRMAQNSLYYPERGTYAFPARAPLLLSLFNPRFDDQVKRACE